MRQKHQNWKQGLSPYFSKTTTLLCSEILDCQFFKIWTKSTETGHLNVTVEHSLALFNAWKNNNNNNIRLKAIICGGSPMFTFKQPSNVDLRNCWLRLSQCFGKQWEGKEGTEGYAAAFNNLHHLKKRFFKVHICEAPCSGSADSNATRHTLWNHVK